MKESLLSILRDKNTSQSQFRKTAERLARLMAAESAQEIEQTPIQIDTPLGKTQGFKTLQNIVLIPILRSGVALLPAYVDVFDEARIGFLGIKRDEKTALPFQYYESIPSIEARDQVFILDPMIATGGSANTAIARLLASGAKQEHITLVGIVASIEGLENVFAQYPKVRIKVVAKDQHLNDEKYIVPGLGDFGNRYFALT